MLYTFFALVLVRLHSGGCTFGTDCLRRWFLRWDGTSARVTFYYDWTRWYMHKNDTINTCRHLQYTCIHNSEHTWLRNFGSWHNHDMWLYVITLTSNFSLWYSYRIWWKVVWRRCWRKSSRGLTSTSPLSPPSSITSWWMWAYGRFFIVVVAVFVLITVAFSHTCVYPQHE